MYSENRPLRVAYFAGSMKPGHDGVTRVLYKLIEGLKSHNIDHIFFSSIIPPESEQPSKMISVPSITFPLYKDYRFAIPGYKHFEDELRSFNPDLIHINSPCTLGYAAVRYAQKNNIPAVATYHTHFTSYARYYKIKALQGCGWNYFRNIYNRCEMVYVPSVPIMKELQQNRIKNLYYLPHGVDTKAFSRIYKSENWKARYGVKDKMVLLYAGRLVWEKDLKTLAEAYKIVTEKRNNAVLVLAGDGPVRSHLEQMMPDAIFLGYQEGKDLSEAYASSDIFVFPSTTETFGNVTVEAMASGIPPVCAREGGAYGIIKEGITGLIAEPRDAVSLSEKIIKLLDDTNLRHTISENAFNFAQTLSWENIFIRLFASYHEVIKNFRECKRNAA